MWGSLRIGAEKLLRTAGHRDASVHELRPAVDDLDSLVDLQLSIGV